MGYSLYGMDLADPTNGLPLRLANTRDGTTDVDFNVSAAGLLSILEDAIARRGGPARWFDVTNYDAKGEGSEEGTEILAAIADAKANGGGIIYFPQPSYVTDSELLVDDDGIYLLGAVAGYNNAGKGTTIQAGASFSGTAIVRFAKTSSNIRSVGMLNLEINGGSSSSCHGVMMVRPYDSCLLSNVTVLKIADAYNCFRFTADFGTIGQTLTCVNLFAIHRNATASVPAYHVERLYESTWVTCKGWAGSGSGDANTSTNDVWLIQSCKSMDLINCAAVATKGFGFVVNSNDGQTDGIHFITPLCESVGKPLKITSSAQRMFGTITSVPSVGDTVKQPSDGSTATGTVYVASASGVYVYDVTGDFTTGTLYNNAGGSIGTITSVDHNAPENVSWKRPRLTGSSSTTLGTSLVDYVNNLDMDWWTTEKTGTDYPLTIAEDETYGTLRLDKNQSHTITNPSLGVDMPLIGMKRVILFSEEWAKNPSSNVSIPAPVRGARLTCVHDVAEGTSAYMTIRPGTGVTIGDGGSGTSGDLWIMGTDSSVTLVGISSTEWQIESFQGRIKHEGAGIRDNVGHWVENKTSSTTLGLQDAGNTYTNTGAGAIADFALPATDGDCVGMEVHFIRDNATYAVTISPNGTEAFQNGGAGKYLSIDSDGGSVTIKLISSGTWAVKTSTGTISYEP